VIAHQIAKIKPVQLDVSMPVEVLHQFGKCDVKHQLDMKKNKQQHPDRHRTILPALYCYWMDTVSSIRDSSVHLIMQKNMWLFFSIAN